MEYITLNKDNIDKEHICCSMSGDAQCKKEWLKARFAEGLVFRRADERGKCFIEYLPAEAAWAPIFAPNYIYIDCLWVSGKFAGSGSGKALLQSCIDDARAQGKAGIVVLSSDKKRAFLSDPKFLSHMGFIVADSAPAFFTLMYLPLSENAEPPRFRSQLKEEPCVAKTGWSLFYADQCPFTAKYVPLLQKVAQEHGEAIQLTHIDSREAAQNAPCPYTNFSLFRNGVFVTHEILSEKKFAALLESTAK